MSKFFMHWFKIKARDFADAGITKLQHRSEIRKFQDSRRKEIYEKVQLTDSQKNQIKELFEKNYGGGVYPISGTDTIQHSLGSLM